MANWQKILAPVTHDVEEHFDKLKYDLYYKLGGPGPIKIVPYRGFGNRGMIYLKGRVLEDKGVSPAKDKDSIWKNIANTWKRINSREVPHARLKVRFMNQEFEITADEEGMFVVEFSPAEEPPTDRLWHPVELELLSPHADSQKESVRAVGEVLIPNPRAGYGVISDVDDTVLVTKAGNILKVARVLFLKNARTRLPFPGVAAFYRAMAEGVSEGEYNPMFYVSSSPWNIYDLLKEFLSFQGFPSGPVLFLRNWGISDREILPVKHREYKLGAIRRIMDMNPELPFILVGDSGQEDPEIYSRVISEYPGRVRCVYIRNVSRDLKRSGEIRELAKKAVENGSALVLADDTEAMAEHAAEHGWIKPERPPDIRTEKEEDEAPPSLMEQLLEEPEEEGPTMKVEGRDREATQQEVEKGAIEESLKTDEKKGKRPPDVVVEPEEEKKRSE